ncbi:MAG: hypothetical protein HY727_16395 [Candidatus Rokubacteria bacterium]|nr:hypothetical protein [Candidatus Rokubacteria bacterium]
MEAAAASVPALPRSRRRDAALALVVVAGLAAVVELSQWMETRRPEFDARAEDDGLYLSGDVARRLALAFNGLAADWYWLRSLQYIGRKIQEQAGTTTLDDRSMVELDRLKAVNPKVLSQLLEMTTALDPHFTAVYEFAAVILPTVDVPAAVRLVERGIRANPRSWYLHQQLAYIHWKNLDYRAAAEAFRRGARTTEAKWMDTMAIRVEAEGGNTAVAREMYVKMWEQATDEQVRQWALRRLMQLRWWEDRDALRRLLAAHAAETGRCPAAWSEVAPRLRGAGIRTDERGLPVDPTGAPYVLVAVEGRCSVALHPRSRVPRD